MQEYARSLLLVSAIAVLAGFLLPEKQERTRRLLEFALGLLVLTVLCRPLSDTLDWHSFMDRITISSPSYTEEIFPPDTLVAMQKAVGDGIAEDLSARYGIPTSCIRTKVTLQLAEQELTISALSITLSGEGMLLDHYAVQAYAAQAYQTKCEVKIDGG